MTQPASHSHDLESGSRDAASIPVQSASVSRPAPIRTYSLNTPSFLRTSDAPAPLLPQPVTAPPQEYGSLPNSPMGRNRAQTVSVAMRARNRAGSASNRERKGSVARSTRDRSGSIISSIRRSGEEGAKSPGSTHSRQDGETRELHDEVVGMLDCIDPQVATMNHLQNISNGLVFPHFPALWNRRPEVVLPESASDESITPLTAPEERQGPQETSKPPTNTGGRSRQGSQGRARSSTVSRLFPPAASSNEQPSTYPFSPTVGPNAADSPSRTGGFAPIPESSPASSSHSLTANQRAELVELEEDVEQIEEDDDLDRHVRHVLNRKTKKEKAVLMLKGLWAYLKTPMGFVVGIYGFLVVFWGAAIVLFLLGWIPTNSRNTQDIWIEISSQVVNGLFTVTGVGLIPWRVMDSYRMIVIWSLKSELVRRRKAQGLKPIEDPNDIPDPNEQADYVSVLSEKEQARLRDQQEKFAKSQTWYKPHATATHKAFPMLLALLNTLLMVGNSFFQCLLCGCMWGMNRHQRPPWTTGSLIPLSFLCGIGAAVLIWQGSARTKKVISVEDKLRSALGVSLAIGGVARTKDGTYVTPGPRASTPPTPKTSSSAGTADEKDRDLQNLREIAEEDEDIRNEVDEAKRRRSTITFGNVAEKVESRPRGTTVAVSAPTLEVPVGPLEAEDNMEMREVAVRPRVAESKE